MLPVHQSGPERPQVQHVPCKEECDCSLTHACRFCCQRLAGKSLAPSDCGKRLSEHFKLNSSHSNIDYAECKQCFDIVLKVKSTIQPSILDQQTGAVLCQEKGILCEAAHYCSTYSSFLIRLRLVRLRTHLMWSHM